MKKLLTLMVCLSMVLAACNPTDDPPKTATNTPTPDAVNTDSTEPPETDGTESPDPPETDEPSDTEEPGGTDTDDSEPNGSEPGPSLEWTSDYDPVYPIVEETQTYNFVTSNERIQTGKWNGYWEDATNIHIEWTYWPETDFDTNWSTSIAGRTLPDLFYLRTRGKAEAYDIGQEGLFVDYRELFQYMPHLLDRMTDFPESVPAISSTDGSIYGLPHIYSTLTAARGTIFYRTDMMEKAGVEVPTTLEEFQDSVVKLQEFYGADNPEFTAFQPDSAGHMGFLEYFFFPSFGPAIEAGFGADEEGNVQYNYLSDQYRRYLDFAHTLFMNPGFDKNIYTEDGNTARPKVVANNAVYMTVGTLFSEENFESGNYDVDMFAPFTSEWQPEQRYRMPDVVHYGGMHMNTEVEDKETLAKWLDSLYAKRENAIAEGVWAITPWIGIEGQDWRYTDEAQGLYEVTPPDDWTDPSTMYINSIGPGNAIGYGRFEGLNTGNLGLRVKGEGTRDKLFPYGVQQFPMSYLNFTEDEQRVLNDVLPDITTYVTDELPKFISGQRNLDEYDSFVADVEDMGIDEVLEVYQAAYDRYLDAQ